MAVEFLIERAKVGWGAVIARHTNKKKPKSLQLNGAVALKPLFIRTSRQTSTLVLSRASRAMTSRASHINLQL